MTLTEHTAVASQESWFYLLDVLLLDVKIWAYLKLYTCHLVTHQPLAHCHFIESETLKFETEANIVLACNRLGPTGKQVHVYL